MAAYVISEISAILDPALMEQYRTLAQTTIKQYDGRYVVRGGAIEKVEGESAPQAIVIAEFPTMANAFRCKPAWQEVLSHEDNPGYPAMRCCVRLRLS